jgi:SIR2-like domain
MTSSSITFAKDDVLVLLGAGASVDAGIPHSAEMVRRIEVALENEWSEFKDLYNYVRSAIFYADGIRGTHPDNASYNIERLVVCLDELARREEHPLYPFVGAWNLRLLQVAGPDFERVYRFRAAILGKLRSEWIELPNFDKARYFKGLITFQRELNYPLHVFTLNYDLCVEKTFFAEYHQYPERGFDKQDRTWSHELLEGTDPGDRSIYLYKLHGSIDWTRASGSKLTYSDSTSTIRIEDGQIIFGLTYKLQYVDPFLFLVYQLRRRSLEARLLLVIGYGFADEHINGILAQALRGEPEKRLLVVTYATSDTSEKRTAAYTEFVNKQLSLTRGDGKVCIHFARAEKFLGEELSLEMVSRFFPEVEHIFDDVPATPPAA